MRKLLKNHKGLTMVEVLVTVALLAIVIVPCLSSFVVAQRGNVLAKQTFDEYTAAANLMETLKGCENSDHVVNMIQHDFNRDSDGIHLGYRCHVNPNYVEVWVFKGEGNNKADLSGEEINSKELILKGVIAP